MNYCLGCFEDVSEKSIQENVCNSNTTIKCETVQQLQARISLLENELKKQKDVAEKGTKFMKVMYGDKFESDSLF